MVGSECTGPLLLLSVYFKFWRAAPYEALWSHTDSLKRIARSTRSISWFQSSRIWRYSNSISQKSHRASFQKLKICLTPKYFNPSPTCPLSNVISSSSSNSASTCPTRNAGLVPSLPLRVSHSASPRVGRLDRGYGRLLAAAGSRDVLFASRFRASSSRWRRRSNTRSCAAAKFAEVIAGVSSAGLCSSTSSESPPSQKVDVAVRPFSRLRLSLFGSSSCFSF